MQELNGKISPQKSRMLSALVAVVSLSLGINLYLTLFGSLNVVDMILAPFAGVMNMYALWLIVDLKEALWTQRTIILRQKDIISFLQSSTSEQSLRHTPFSLITGQCLH